MKNLKYTCIVLLFLLFTSCKDEDDTIIIRNEYIFLENTYSILNYNLKTGVKTLEIKSYKNAEWDSITHSVIKNKPTRNEFHNFMESGLESDNILYYILQDTSRISSAWKYEFDEKNRIKTESGILPNYEINNPLHVKDTSYDYYQYEYNEADGTAICYNYDYNYDRNPNNEFLPYRKIIYQLDDNNFINWNSFSVYYPKQSNNSVHRQILTRATDSENGTLTGSSRLIILSEDKQGNWLEAYTLKDSDGEKTVSDYMIRTITYY